MPELVHDEILKKSGAAVTSAALAPVPMAKPTQLAEADAIIFGTPTRFGNMAAQMRNFLDQTGGLWAKGALGSAFTSTASQPGGHETTLISFYMTLLPMSSRNQRTALWRAISAFVICDMPTLKAGNPEFVLVRLA